MSKKKLDNLMLLAFTLFFLFSWFLIPDYAINLVCLAFCNGLVVLGLLMLMRVGLVSFGHGMYYCLGGYAVAMTYNFLDIKEAFILIFIAAILGLVISLILGFFVRRFRGIFFAMLNLALSMILFGIIVKSVTLGSTDGFGIKEAYYLGQTINNESRLNLYSYSFIITTSAVGTTIVAPKRKTPIKSHTIIVIISSKI